MESVSANAIMEITMETSCSIGRPDRFVNRFRYRADTSADSFNLTQLRAAMEVIDWSGRWWGLVRASYYCSRLAAQIVYPFEGLKEEVGYDPTPNEWVGEVADSGGPEFNPAMCAVVTKKSFRPGRVGVGHTYFGPLEPSCITSGFIDPTGGTPVLTPLLDLLHDPLTILGTTWKPVVSPGKLLNNGSPIVTVDSTWDVRSVYFAPLTTELESRRTGKGS